VTVYLTPIEVMVMQRVLVERFGGAHGLRDAGALEAALFRPQSGYYDDIVWEAAALFESLAMNHPFIDGNKRIAFAAVDVFLRVNGWRIQGKPMAVHKWMIGALERGAFNIANIEPWLRKHATKMPPGRARR
jgi:death-on-curing protein